MLAAVAVFVVGTAVLLTEEGEPDTLRVVDITTTSSAPTTTTNWPKIEVAMQVPVVMGTARTQGEPIFVATAPDESKPVFYVSERRRGEPDLLGHLVRYEGTRETARVEIEAGPIVVTSDLVLVIGRTDRRSGMGLHVFSRALEPQGSLDFEDLGERSARKVVVRNKVAYVLLVAPDTGAGIAKVSLRPLRVEKLVGLDALSASEVLADRRDLLVIGEETQEAPGGLLVAVDPETLAERRRVPLPVGKVQDAVLGRGRLYLVPELTEPGHIHVADPVSGRQLGTVDTWWPRYLVADDANAYVSVRRVETDGSRRFGDGMIGLFQLKDHQERGYTGPCEDDKDTASRLALNQEYLFVACSREVVVLSKADDAKALAEESKSETRVEAE